MSKFSGNDDILLGYQQEARRTMGFAGQLQPPAPDGEPIYYGGPHLLTCAPTGAGKGRCCAVPALLEYPGQVVTIDIKGELYGCTHRRRRELGQQVVKLDPFRVVDSTTDGFNPLEMFQLPTTDFDTDSQMVASMLSEGNKFGRDPFWDTTASGLHSAIINYLVTLQPKEKQNLNEMRRLLCSDDVVYKIAVLMDTVGKQMRELAYQEFASFLQLAERETRPSVLATAQSYIKTFNSERVSEMLEKSSFSLQDFADGKPMSIYIIIPPERLESHKPLLRIILASLFAAVFSRKKIPNPRSLFLIDEAGNLGSFPVMKAAMTLCRGFGLRCWTFWQDMQQIQDCYPTCWKTMINNAGALQLFGLNTRMMAKEWADVLGCSAEMLLSLKPHEQFLQLQDQGEFISRRLDYLTDPRYSGHFDDNRFYSL
ncbi:MAG: type IV secretory system conjugative DNA transfer family protein [Planctomycetes bacterium]|nr:type IV secretory system conjugative DNA transfer family protein [Planctomycetota bacterium]